MKILYPLAKRFIAGYSFDSAKSTIENLLNSGYEVSIDYVGEESKTQEDCRKAFSQYLKIIEYFKNKKINISIKPSQLGMKIHPHLSLLFIGGIAKKAKSFGHTIRLDMEDSTLTELTRNLALSLNKKYENVGVAVQANLHRTEKDLFYLIKKGVSVRLVKGAYKESEEIAYQEDYEIEAQFYHLAATLYSRKANQPAVATHDEELLDDIRSLIPNSDYFDYEFLYGVRRDLQRDFKNKGHRVRIYVPFGESWLPYVIRRLKEWRNLKFVIKNIFKEMIRWETKTN